MTRLYSKVAVHGTRDSFGINKAFYDEKTGQTIDTWKKWEKAGFSNPLEHKDKRSHDLNERVKEKMEKKKKRIMVGGK